MQDRHVQLQALFEKHQIEDAGERTFATLAFEDGSLNSQNFGKFMEWHRAGSRETYDLIAELETSLPVSRRRPNGHQEKTSVRAGTGPEHERTKVFARHVGRLASVDLGVRMFRRSLLGSPTAVLSAARARKLVESPAVRYLTWSELRSAGVPLDGTHSSTIKPVGTGMAEICASWLGGSATWRCEESSTRPIQLPGQEATTMATPESFLDVLAGPGGQAWLIGSARGWPVADTAWFLLTGHVPAMAPVTVGRELHFSTGRAPTKAWIIIKAQPHVSPDTIRAAYAGEQRRLTKQRKGRNINPRALALVDFVGEQIARQGRRPDFEHLLPKWNDAQKPAWRFDYPSTMKRYYEDTVGRVFLSVRPAGGLTPCDLAALEQALSERPHAPSYFHEVTKGRM